MTARFLWSDTLFSLAWAGLDASRMLLQWLLTSLNFTLSHFFSFDTNKRNDLYGLWQQHKQLKTVETNKAWSDIYNVEVYRHILQLVSNQNIAAVAKASSYKISADVLNDFKDHPNQPKNNQKLSNEQEHYFLSLKENQWKLRQQHDQNSPKEWKPL